MTDTAPPFDLAVVWHDTECHGYAADVAIWLNLADAEAGPILDIGSGTGRVALELADAGHEVVALDLDGSLLGALAERARERELEIETVQADATEFALGRRFGFVLIAMNTIQMLDPERRSGFWSAVREHLAPGGLVALTLTDPFDGFDMRTTDPTEADESERDGWRFSSQPTVVSYNPISDVMTIERIRTVHAPGGDVHSTEDNAVAMHILSPELLAEESGLALEHVGWIDPTADHVGSQVVHLRG